MDYSDFQFRSAVDWLEIQIQTAQPTAFDAIKRHGKFSFVEPQDPASFGEGKSATIFNIRIHDPANWQQVIDKVSNIGKRFPLAKPIDVVGLEIALDAIPKSGTTTMLELATMAAHFTRATTQAHVKPRLYREKKDPSFMPIGFDTTVRHMAEGYQFGSNDKDSDCYLHGYAKTTDNNKKLLHPSKHRARIEITLRGAMLPCKTLEKWSCFGFEKLARQYFSFREFDYKGDTAPPPQGGMNHYRLAELMHGQSSNFGRHTERQKPRDKLHRKNSQADSVLNAHARYALRNLSERWRTAGRQSKRASTEDSACRNSGDSFRASDCNNENQKEISNNYLLEDLIADNNQASDTEPDTEPHRQPDYDEAIGFADSLQSESEIDSPLEDTISINSRCEFLQSCLDTALEKSLKTNADEQQAEQDRILKLVDRVKRREKRRRQSEPYGKKTEV